MGNIARILGNWGLQWVCVGSIVMSVGNPGQPKAVAMERKTKTTDKLKTI